MNGYCQANLISLFQITSEAVSREEYSGTKSSDQQHCQVEKAEVVIMTLNSILWDKNMLQEN